MGMFDYVTVKMKLPMPVPIQGYKGSDNFQTKDLENCLFNYIIKSNGTLWVEKVDYTYVPPTEEEKKKSAIFAIGKNIVNKRWTERVRDVSGKVTIYDYQEHNGKDENFDYYIEYDILFKEGKVTSIEITRFEVSNNFARKNREQEFIENDLKRRELENKWYFKTFCKPWNKIISSIFRRTVSFNFFKLRQKLLF